MRLIAKSDLFLVFTLVPALAAAAPAARSAVPVAVDPRIELMSVIFRLAGNEEYNDCRVPGYADDVDAAFGDAADHPAVAMARKLENDFEIDYDAPMSLALHLTDPPDLALRVPLDPYPESLGRRWRNVDVEAFLAAVRDFAADTGFMDFFARHRDLYRLTSQRLEESFGDQDPAHWYADYFGVEAGATFSIEPALLNGGSSYGPRYADPTGPEEVHAILGVWRVDETGQPWFSPGAFWTVVHEFAHSFVNPAVAAHRELFASAGPPLFAAVADTMEGRVYGDWENLVSETLVRAVTLRRLAGTAHRDQVPRYARDQQHRGFYWLPDVVDLLATYESRRRDYPIFAAFLPVVADTLTAWATDADRRIDAIEAAWAAEAEDRRLNWPHVVATVPPNGAVDVDPNLAAMSFTFDHEMRDGSWSVMNTGMPYPEVTGKPSYDAARTTLTMPVRLKPGVTYGFALNRADGGGFQTKDGHPLARYVVRFTTRAE